MNKQLVDLFQSAKACFGENAGQYSHTLDDPNLKAIMWNLNKGLHDLCEALEISMNQIHAHLDQTRK
jgi:hypothetical protein